MAPAKPTTFTAGLHSLERFDGAICFEWVQPQLGKMVKYDETFRFNCRMRPFKGIYKKHLDGNTKPPVHFHRYQWECFDVHSGDFTVEIDGKPRRVTKDDGGVYLPPYSHHVVYGTPGVVQEEVTFTVTSEDVRKSDGPTNGQLDRLFFENWYGYQEDVFRADGKFDFIQVLSMFDAGDTYVTLPSWVPFRCTVAIGLGIVVGRWAGGLMGYQPFFPEWTTDWNLACAHMEKTWTQRKFANRNAPVVAKERFTKDGVFDSNIKVPE